jgi:uncharacterized membrane protein YqhA
LKQSRKQGVVVVGVVGVVVVGVVGVVVVVGYYRHQVEYYHHQVEYYRHRHLHLHKSIQLHNKLSVR